LRKLIESDFITRSGTRAPVFLDDKSDGDGSAKAVAELESRHVVRAEEWRPGARLYELTHDRLIEPIRMSNQTYRARRRWRWWLASVLAFAALAGGISAAFVLLTGGEGGPFGLIQYAQLRSPRPPTALSSASFSPRGDLVMTAGADGKARVWIWRPAPGHSTLLHVLNASPKALSSASFSPQGSFSAKSDPAEDFILTAGADGVARIWKFPGYERKVALRPDNPSPLTSASFSPDGTLVITADADGAARVWLWSENRPKRPPWVLKARQRAALTSASFSPDGTLVVTAGADGVARVWDWVTERVVKNLAGPEPAPLSGASFSPDGKRVVTGGTDGVLRVWQWREGKQLAEVTERSPIRSTVFNSLGQFVLTACEDGAARVWTWDSTKDPVRVAQRPAALSSAVLSPIGSLVLTADTDGFATIYGPTQVGS
jgi:WD40 repeat protein